MPKSREQISRLRELTPFKKPSQFSDPYSDWWGSDKLCTLLENNPETFAWDDFTALFGSCLPIGSCSESGYFIPWVISFLKTDKQDGVSDVLDNFLSWLALEREELSPYPLLLEEIQRELTSLFHEILTSFVIKPNADHHYYPIGCSMVFSFFETLFSTQSFNTHCGDGTKHLHEVLHWDMDAFFEPLLTQMDYPHTSWLLYSVSDALYFNWPHLHPTLEYISIDHIRSALERLNAYLIEQDEPLLYSFWEKEFVHLECFMEQR